MDYLDRKKALQSHIMLFVGYILVAIAIAVAALILLQLAYGFGITRQGDVIQNGLTFFSSRPNPADIYVNGERKPQTTNTRMVLPAGIYDVRLTREGYHDWNRTIELEGGSVKHYDYPFLFPKQINTEQLEALPGAPRVFSQSRDERWLVVQSSAIMSEFSVFDLKDPNKAPITINLPDTVLTKPTVGQSETWESIAWADNNNHVLLLHTVGDKQEYILLNRSKPAESQNLTISLNLAGGELSFVDQKHDKYYLFNRSQQTLQSLSLKDPTPQLVQRSVLAFQPYQENMILYATTEGAGKDKALVKVKDGDKQYVVRSFPVDTDYLLDLTEYDDTMYVVVSAVSGNRVYIYQDPVGQRKRQPQQMPAPIQVLHVDRPQNLSFSATAQLIMAQNANRFGVYDIENESGYNYTTQTPLDAPQKKAEWMDGHRLFYVSQGKLTVFDYDNINIRTLMNANPAYAPVFGPDHEFVYSIGANGNGQTVIQQTALLTQADQ